MDKRAKRKSAPRASIKTERPATVPRWNVPAWPVAIPLALVTFAAFWPALANGFVRWDDHVAFQENFDYRGLGWHQLRWAWTTFLLGAYQPLGWMIYEAQYTAWGLDPREYHVVSLILHAANVVALYYLTLALLDRGMPGPTAEEASSRRLVAGLAVALFAVHPLRTEVVAWVTCQTYLPCALFAILSVRAYLYAADAQGNGRAWWLAGSVLLFAGSLASHAVPVGLPIVLLVLDVYPLRRLKGQWRDRSARRVVWEKLPFVGLSLVFAGVAILARRSGEGIGQADPMTRLADACQSVWFYLAKTVMPLGISAYYPRPSRIDPLDRVCVVATVALTIALILARRRWPACLAAWAAYLVILGPNSGLVRIGSVRAADRYSYLATMPGVVLLATGLVRLTKRGRAIGAGIAVAGVAAIVGLGVLSWRQCRTWNSTVAMWSHAVARSVDPDFKMQISLAEAHAFEGRYAEALAPAIAAVRIDPGSAKGHYRLGYILARLGRRDEAIAQYREALRLKPDFADAHHQLGFALDRQGDLDEALAQFAEAVRLDPGRVESRVSLGWVLFETGRLDEAIAEYREALRLDPAIAETHNNLGQALAKQGKRAEAIAEYRETLRLDPNHPEALRALKRENQSAGGTRGRSTDDKDLHR